jgi:HEAT repeat protein
MRRTMALLLLVAAALGHGENARTQASAWGTPAGTFVRPGGRDPMPGPGDRPPSPSTSPDRTKRHTWETWWSYHREYYLAVRARGVPLTGPRAAADRAGAKQLREGRLTDLMIEAIGDKDPDVRAAAAIALGKFGLSTGVARALERHVNDERFDVRESSIYAIGLLGLPEYRLYLGNLTRDRERGAKEQGLALAGLMMDGTKESADALVAQARGSEPDRRRFAAHLLGFVDHPGYDDFLGQIITGGRPWEDHERGLAITALGRRRAREQKEALFRTLYQHDPDLNIIRSAAIALGMLLAPGDESDLKRLARFIRDSRRDTIAQNFGVMALGQVGGDTAVEQLRDLLSGRVFGDAEDRAFVYLALGLAGLRSEKARETLVSEYDRARSEVEISVLALACGLARAKEAIPITLDRLAKPGGARDGPGLGARGRFAGWAALGLGFHGEASGTDAARRVFEGSNDPVVREQAAIGLTLLLRAAVVPELISILRDSGTLHGKAAAVAAFAVLPEASPEAVDALVAVYREDGIPNPVRAMAISALGALADPRPIPVSALLSRNYNYYIRCLALDEIVTYL